MIRKLRKTDLDEVAYIWLHTNKKAHDFIAETYWDEHFEMVEGMLGDAEIYVFEEQGQIKGFVGLDGEYIAGIFVREALLHVKRKTGKCCGTQLDDDIDGVFYEG